MNYKRETFLPFCLPMIGEPEIEEVVDSIRSGWITTGPKVKRFEQSFAEYVGSKHAIAVQSCTAALHLALASLGIGPGDEVIVPTLTFCATANVVVHLGARPVIVDIDDNLQMSIEQLSRAITPRTRAIVPVHFAGQACDMDEILAIAGKHRIPVIEDAAHAAGSEYRGRKIGTIGNATAFSFYATKNMTTGEGGMLTTDDDAIAKQVRLLSLHGMSRDAWKRYTQEGSWFYEVTEAGYKSNMTDIQAALGIHQLARLDGFNTRRCEIAHRYSQAFAGLPDVALPRERSGRNHIYHLYCLRLSGEPNRSEFIRMLSEANIGSSVHFIPLHRHPFYRERYGYSAADFPVAERIFEGLVSLPLYPKMTDEDVDDVIRTVREVIETAEASRAAFVTAQ